MKIMASFSVGGSCGAVAASTASRATAGHSQQAGPSGRGTSWRSQSCTHSSPRSSHPGRGGMAAASCRSWSRSGAGKVSVCGGDSNSACGAGVLTFSSKRRSRASAAMLSGSAAAGVAAAAGGRGQARQPQQQRQRRGRSRNGPGGLTVVAVVEDPAALEVAVVEDPALAAVRRTLPSVGRCRLNPGW